VEAAVCLTAFIGVGVCGYVVVGGMFVSTNSLSSISVVPGKAGIILLGGMFFIMGQQD